MLQCVRGLDVSPLKKSRKRIGDFEFAPPCQTGQISDRAPPIEEQKYPTVSARELAGKRGGVVAGDHAEHGRWIKDSFLYSKFHHLSSPLYTR